MPDDSPTAVETVARWMRATRARDIDAAMDCVAEDVRVVSNGTKARGRDELRAWFVTTTATIEPLRWFARDEDVVVELLRTTVPRDPEREAPHVAMREASHYRVQDGRITCIEHQSDPDEARRRAGLDETDLVEAPTS
jgi:hypothetical protein